MKKVLVTILAIFYLGVSSGATVHLYYCMDKLVGWSFSAPTSNRCFKCGMNKKLEAAKQKPCCKHEQKQVKLTNDQKLAENTVHLIHLSSLASGVPNFINQVTPLISLAQEYPVSHAPPINSGVDLNLLYCVFQI